MKDAWDATGGAALTWAKDHPGDAAAIVAGGVCIASTFGVCAGAVGVATTIGVTQDAFEASDFSDFLAHAGPRVLLSLFALGGVNAPAWLASEAGAFAELPWAYTVFNGATAVIAAFPELQRLLDELGC